MTSACAILFNKARDHVALQKTGRYMECSCQCEVVRVVDVHVKLDATFQMKSNTSKVVAKHTDVLKTFLYSVEDAIDKAQYLFLWFPRPSLPPSMTLHQ